MATDRCRTAAARVQTLQQIQKPMIHLIILLLALGFIIWVLKSQRYSDGLFLLTVAASGITFLKGLDLLGPVHSETNGRGVALVSISLVVILVAAIAFKALGSRVVVPGQGDTEPPDSQNGKS